MNEKGSKKVISIKVCLETLSEILTRCQEVPIGQMQLPNLSLASLTPSQVEAGLSGLDILETVARTLLAFTMVAKALLNTVAHQKM